MEACNFPESNNALSKPLGMIDEYCGPLSVCHTMNQDGFPCVVSCWKPSQEELDEIIKTKRVWLIIIGQSIPFVESNHYD